MSKELKISLSLILTMLLIACGKSSKPKEVAEKYVKASLEFDFGTVKDLCSENSKGKANLAEKLIKTIPGVELGGALLNLTTQNILELKAEKPKIKGKSASVQIYYQFEIYDLKKEMNQEVLLIKEKGIWKVDCMNIKYLLN